MNKPQEPDPYRDPEGFVLARRWLPWSGLDVTGAGLWVDSKQPEKDSYHRVLAYEKELPDGSKEPVYQTVCTPGRAPMSLRAAVARELHIDHTAKFAEAFGA
jgi:hypothetical protein